MHSAIDGRGQSRYLPGRSNDEAKDGRVAKNQNGDGQDESENKEVDVVEATGGLWRVVGSRWRAILPVGRTTIQITMAE